MKIEDIDIIKQENMEQCGFGPEIMKKIKICKSCGCVSPEDEKYCRECGELLPKKTLFQNYLEKHKCCKKCQTIVADNKEYCPQCGTKI